MIPHERVFTALDHREPDRVPIDLASCGPTGIHTAIMESKTSALGKAPLRDTLDFFIAILYKEI